MSGLLIVLSIPYRPYLYFHRERRLCRKQIYNHYSLVALVSKGEESSSLMSSLKAFIVAPLIFLIVLGSIFAYSGIWPPLVVIESKSMQHSPTESYIGVIDTGDIVIVKGSDSIDDVVTYVEGYATGFETYSEYGDVIIYYRSGMEKPVIHRAIVELEYNFTGGGFDIPSLQNLPASMWSVPGERTWWNLKESVTLYDIGYADVRVEIDLASMLSYMQARGTPHGGLITMGDNNWYTEIDGTNVGRYDQKWITSVQEPITSEWLIGKSRGELPWFGLLKLWATNTAPSYTPENSKTGLLVSLGLIIAVPVALDASNSLLKKRGIDMFAWTHRLSPRRLWTRLKGKKGT